jgi:hypothetical protein
MNHVPRTLGNWIIDEVDLPDLELGAGVVFEPSRVEVGRHHPTGRTHALGEPASVRTTSRTNLQTPSASGDPEPFEVTDGHRVERALQSAKTVTGLGLGVTEQILGHNHRLPDDGVPGRASPGARHC